MEYMQLNNGIKIPVLGYGLFMVDPLKSEEYVCQAVETGYRLIDTAQVYDNEAGVGNALKKSGIRRDEFFIVSKIWHTNAGSDKALKYPMKKMWENEGEKVLYIKSMKLVEKEKGEIAFLPNTLRERYEFLFQDTDLKDSKKVLANLIFL